MEKKYNILTTIDSLMDTRMSLLFKLDKGLSMNALVDGSYHNRLSNTFGNINCELFDKSYKHRDKTILEEATPTYIFNLIVDYISSVRNNTIENIDITVYVNIYPYKLMEHEMDLLEKSIYDKLNDDDFKTTNVNIVNVNPSEMDLVWILNNIAMIIDYDGIGFLEGLSFKDRLTKSPLLGISLFYPALVYDSKLNKKDSVEAIKGMVSALSIFIQPTAIDVENFSTVVR